VHGVRDGETARDNASVLEYALLVWSKELVLVEPCCEEAPFKELFADNVMSSATPFI